MDVKHKELEEKFTDIQMNLQKKIDITKQINLSDIKLIAGVDLAYWEEEGEHLGVCCVVVCNFHTGEVIENVWSSGIIDVPYIPGFLAFRELPLFLKANEKLKQKPDVYMFDGNGYLHYRNMGIATQASFDLNIPTIGVAKSYFKIENIDYNEPDNGVGSYSDIIIHNKIYGRTLRTTENVKPIFISCGNWIDLSSTTDIVLSCITDESRIPYPTRLADIETHKMRKSLSKNIIK